MIDGHEYSLTQVAPYPDAERIYRKLHPYIARIVQALEIAHLTGQKSAVGIAMGELVADDKLVGLVNELLKTGGLRCDNEKIVNPPKHIAETGMHRMYEIWMFALMINFEEVFMKLLERVGGLFEELDPKALKEKLLGSLPGAAGQ